MVARYDLTTDLDLQDQLLTVRRGTAFWHRKVGELNDAELDGDTLLSGWNRRHLVAHVGYNARAISRLVYWANTGIETPMYSSPEDRNREIELGATMPTRALRHLNDHAAVSLNVEWRDTPAEKWENIVRTAQGRQVPLSETVWMRTREVWLHAIDLDNGARFSDVPISVLERLLGDITGAWRNRGTDPGFAIEVTGRPDLGVSGAGAGEASATSIQGSLSAVVSWASGRDTTALTVGRNIQPPRWL
ncbi:maleylpyruvate isomerase family mycothiol-dependent enzyme [Nesterenkonia muleiensis]|uniref:maleylpyruvate isomerase family mycothiol-dependent enzyme n=1 Tax=Nesterenkonia muleiensis TaxID=2282648 RepID=UPI000E70B047|nr:maleylpyruvate isomerase family mycothiol-dependent enzyme [Nesterenkonia muleiensis]